MVKKFFSSIGNILTREQNEIISAAVMLMALLLATKVVGMVFLSMVASQFGATGDTDLFYLASVIPETITNIILLGSISGAIIPVLIKVKEERGSEKFGESFSSIMNLGMLSFMILSLVVMIFAKYTIPLAMEALHSTNELTKDDIDKVVSMMRILLIPQILLGASAFISSGLNIYQRFIIPQLSPLFYNLGRILALVILVPFLHDPIWSLVWGTLLGAILHLLVQLPLWKKLKIGYKIFYLDMKDKNVVQAIKLGLPRMLGLSVEEVARIVDSLISFSLTMGSLTAYQYAVRLTSIPLNLFGTSYAIASFPTLSKLWANNKKDEFEVLVKRIINQVIFLSLPVSVIFLILRVPIVRLVYGILGGNFTWENTLQVSWVLMFFAVGISLETLRTTIFRIYFAVHDSVTPFISSIFVLIFGVISGIMLTNYLSHFNVFAITKITFVPSYFFSKSDGPLAVGGLALSSSLVFGAEFFFLLIILRYKRILTKISDLLKEILLKVGIAVVMAILTFFLAKVWEDILRTELTVQLMILTFTSSGIAFIMYIILCKLFKVEEVNIFLEFLDRVRKKISFSKR